MFRSLLFVPGNNPSMIQNADIFSADGIIFDLEDSVDLNEKDNARNLVLNYLKTSKTLPKTIVLRVNPVETEFFEKDLELVLTKKIDYIMLPKSDCDTLNILDDKISDIESLHPEKSFKVLALVESAKSIIEVYKIAKHKRVEGILLGAEDLCSELEIPRSDLGNEISFARSRVIYSCTAQKIIPIDTPNTSIDNPDSLRKDCHIARNLGMKAKTAIHPNQLDIINEVFSPSKAEIKWAKEVMKLKKDNPSKGAFSLNGKMIDKPLINKAERILEKAKAFKLL